MNKKWRVFLAVGVVACVAAFTLFSISSFKAQAIAPTATPKPGAVFSPKNYNKNKKNIILAILEWFRGGGGGPLMLCDAAGPNSMLLEKLTGWNFNNSFELMDAIAIIGCNWPVGEQLNLTIKYPNGKTLTHSMPVQAHGGDRGGNSYDFRPTLDDPPGKYQVSIQGNSATASASMSFSRPSGLDMYWLGNNNLLLRGFAPYETVQIVSYDSANRFQGWQDYQVGKDGSLFLKAEFPARSLIMTSSFQKGIDLVLEIPDSGMGKASELCTQALQPRLQTQAWAAALENINYYPLPDTRSKVIRQMQTQSQHFVLEGPWCAEGKWWWRLESKKGFSGYVIEADRTKYYLIPVG